MTCTITPNDLLGALQNPATDANFLTTGYSEPSGPPCTWSIKIYYDGTAYNFRYFYESQSMEIQSTYGERGYARFVIVDAGEESTELPFIPVEEMYIEIYNQTEEQLYFAGYTRDINQYVLDVRTDYSEMARYEIMCTDLYHELERKSIKRVYENKTLGFIIRDVIWRYTTLDAADIDSNLGFTLEKYPINAKTPSQVLTHITELTNTTYYIEPGTKKLLLLPKTDGVATFSKQITDENLYDVFDRDTFSIRRQNDAIKNKIDFWFNERYDKGTVNVSTGGASDNVVVGYGSPPLTEWDDIPVDDLKFKLKSSDAIYNVEKNLSSGATQEMRLTSDYKEGSATNQEYELRGMRRVVHVSDEESIALMRTLRGDDGVFTYVVSEDQNYLTWTEARRFASALLALSRPLPQGQGTTFNDVFMEFPLIAGRVMSFSLPQSKRFQGDIVIQGVTLRDLGGEVDMGGAVHPYLQIDFQFTATLTNDQAQLRKMMQDLRKVKVNIEDAPIEGYGRIPETWGIKGCLHANTPTNISEALTLSDAVQVRTETAGPLYYTEYDYYLNDVDYAFTSD